MRWALVCAWAVFAVVAPFVATAQTSNAPTENADTRSPNERAAAKAENTKTAMALIEKFGVSDLFTDASDDNAPAIVHTQSKLLCQVNADADIAVFPLGPRGDDVACTSTDSIGTKITLYATRFTPPVPVNEVFRMAEAAISQRGFSPWTGDTLSIGLGQEGALDRPMIGRYVGGADPRLFTKLMLVQVGGWTLKLRATAPAPTDDEVMKHDLFSGVAFLAAQMNMADLVPSK